MRLKAFFVFTLSLTLFLCACKGSDDDTESTISTRGNGSTDGTEGEADDSGADDNSGGTEGETDSGGEEGEDSDSGLDATKRDKGPAPDAGEPKCNHDPQDCTYQPTCTIDDDCPCSFTCTEGKCLSQHCVCANERGEAPCGQGMECDQNSGLCVKISDPCKSDSDCQDHGPAWYCEDSKCKRDDPGCKTDADCSDYAPALYTCVNGICSGAGQHGDSCPNHSDMDCASGHVCIDGTCKAICDSPGQPCPPPASGTCYEESFFGIATGLVYCK